MKHVIEFLIIFPIIFLIFWLVNLKKRKKELAEIIYLTKKYKLDLNKIGRKKLLLVTNLTNAFVITITGVIVFVLAKPIYQVIGACFVLFSLLLFLYDLIGKYYIKKGYQKNV